MNMTLDGVCDHTVGIPDEDLHRHYAELLGNAGVILYGRITYELMQYWQAVLRDPSGVKSTDDFASAIDAVPKIVFSRTLQTTGWESASLASDDLKKEVVKLKQESGKDIVVGSRSLIVQLINLKLIDEFQICIHPMVAGSGLPLFGQIEGMTIFRLLRTKVFSSGSIVLHYELTENADR